MVTSILMATLLQRGTLSLYTVLFLTVTEMSMPYICNKEKVYAQNYFHGKCFELNCDQMV